MRNPVYKSRPVAPSPARFGGERINEFILLSEAFSNSYLIETTGGNVQLNAGMGMEIPVIDANFRQFNREPIHSLILTQGHVDHVGGTAYLRARNAGLRVIAAAQNAEHQAYEARLSAFRANRSAFAFAQKFVDIFAYYAEQGLCDFPEQDAPVPDLLVEDRFSFELGDTQFELLALPGAETNDSLIVWLPQHKICFTGNLFGCPFGHFPNLFTVRGDRYRDALQVARAVQAVRELEAEMICYGHHSPVIGKAKIDEELNVLHRAIHFVHDAVVEGMNAGKTVHQLMQEIRLPAELEVGEGYGKVSWGVRAIWEHYAGWFHHESTTELYSVPRSSIDTDLIELAGGSQAVLQRALEKFEAQKCEEALHLLDIIRRSGVETEQSKRLSLQVHQQLLNESDNFWLTAWLTNQIEQL